MRDNWPDLILAGEWRPITVFENQKGTLVNITAQSGLQDYSGWWTSLAYNGSIDPLISCYWQDSLGVKHEYLYHPLQDVIKQFVAIRKKYNSFGEFGEATVPEIFEEINMEDITVLTSTWMKTSWIENLGNGKFDIHALSKEAQLAPVYGILPYALNEDKHLDVLLIGNDFGMEVQQGRADAFSGLVLQNKGEKQFSAWSLAESDFFVPGDAKSLVSLKTKNEKLLLLASQNNDELKVFERQRDDSEKLITLEAREVKCELFFSDGTSQIREFYPGTTFQSQSSKTIQQTNAIKEVRCYDAKGKMTRTIQ